VLPSGGGEREHGQVVIFPEDPGERGELGGEFLEIGASLAHEEEYVPEVFYALAPLVEIVVGRIGDGGLECFAAGPGGAAAGAVGVLPCELGKVPGFDAIQLIVEEAGDAGDGCARGSGAGRHLRIAGEKLTQLGDDGWQFAFEREAAEGVERLDERDGIAHGAYLAAGMAKEAVLLLECLPAKAASREAEEAAHFFEPAPSLVDSACDAATGRLARAGDGLE